MSCAQPEILWLLLVFPPAMMVFYWWAGKNREKLWTQFIQQRLLGGLLSGVSPVRRRIRFALLVTAATALILALARPEWGAEWEVVTQRGLDIVVAVDTSKSMLAEDVPPNRLERAKLAVQDLMRRAGTDRLGLVAFAGSAFLQCPLTIDDTAFRQSVQALDVKTIPEGGTAIAEAINTSLSAFQEGDNYKVLVLFTDGEDQEPGALDAAKRAAAEGLHIFTIGIGSKEGEILRIRDDQGNSEYIRDEQGNVVKSHLNEALLQEIAGAANGFYLPLRGAKAMDTLYDRGLAPLPKSESKEKLVKRRHERYQLPLALAILCLMAEILMPETARERKGIPAASGKPAVVAALLCICVLPALPASASPASALRDYHQGKYATALAEYQRLAETETNDWRLLFNAGTAAYRATNYDAALTNFSRVTAAPDVRLQQQAYYNLGNTQFLMAESGKDLDGIQSQWETAMKNFERAHALDTNDVDAAHNLAFVQNCIARIKELREAALRAKLAADGAVRNRSYHQALEIMDSLLKQNPFARAFQDFSKRLKDIDDIATPHQP
jgi:Ca-activated chloride channel family protein